ncbi:MAG: hypothetical protein WDM89_21785 [Rhizomicrobium sp.]
MNSRSARLEGEIASLELEFRTKLIAALRNCAKGKWGLFGQNNYLIEDHSSEAEELLEIGSSIEDLRRKAGMPERFSLYERFLSKRGRKGENALGEPRLAVEWLNELSE